MGPGGMLEESKALIFFGGLYVKSRLIVANLIKNSKIADLSSDIKGSFFNKAVKSASIFIFTGISVNILFSMAAHKEIGPIDVITKGSVLFLSLAGFFCNSNWEDVKKSSVILTKIFK